VKSLVAGVDGGGTKTHVILADAEGVEVASGEGGPSAITPGRIERTADAIATTLDASLAGEDRDESAVVMLVVGVAGAGREEERAALERELRRRSLADEVRVETDAAIALADAFGDGAGVLLVSGTGSIAYGRGPTGEIARCGGWGPAIGDEGSGAWIGRRALAVVAAAADGREPPTALTGAILTAAQVNEPEELIPWAAAADGATLAALAPAVFTTARADARANAIVDFAVEELVLHARALALRLFGDERAAFPIALSGGLLKKGSFLRRKLEHRLKTATPGGAVRGEPVLPARGAVKLALQRMRAAAVSAG
jgi:glucosamine kinase